MFTDTHTHLYYAENAPDVVNRALESGVDRLIMPGVDLGAIKPMKTLADHFPNNIRLTMGLHPTEVKEDADDVLDAILTELQNDKRYIGVGEIGIDLYWDKTFREKQMQVFDRQLEAASQMSLPVIIHCREGLDETLEVLESYPNVNRVFHCFSGNIGDVERILSQHETSYFGIGGVVTFKNSTLRNTLCAIPHNRILLETDSPYLAPVPYRGKTNESAYLPYVARSVAETLAYSLEEVASLTASNSKQLFGF